MKLLFLTGYSQLDTQQTQQIRFSSNQYDVTAAYSLFTATFKNFTLLLPFLQIYYEIIP